MLELKVKSRCFVFGVLLGLVDLVLQVVVLALQHFDLGVQDEVLAINSHLVFLEVAHFLLVFFLKLVVLLFEELQVLGC